MAPRKPPRGEAATNSRSPERSRRRGPGRGGTSLAAAELNRGSHTGIPGSFSSTMPMIIHRAGLLGSFTAWRAAEPSDDITTRWCIPAPCGSIATPTGEGVTNPRTFTRVRRCVMVDNLRIY